jgi:hypothetical protein
MVSDLTTKINSTRLTARERLLDLTQRKQPGTYSRVQFSGQEDSSDSFHKMRVGPGPLASAEASEKGRFGWLRQAPPINRANISKAGLVTAATILGGVLGGGFLGAFLGGASATALVALWNQKTATAKTQNQSTPVGTPNPVLQTVAEKAGPAEKSEPFATSKSAKSATEIAEAVEAAKADETPSSAESSSSENQLKLELLDVALQDVAKRQEEAKQQENEPLASAKDTVQNRVDALPSNNPFRMIVASPKANAAPVEALPSDKPPVAPLTKESAPELDDVRREASPSAKSPESPGLRFQGLLPEKPMPPATALTFGMARRNQHQSTAVLEYNQDNKTLTLVMVPTEGKPVEIEHKVHM